MNGLGSNGVFRRAADLYSGYSETATIGGVAKKTLLLIITTVISAIVGILIALPLVATSYLGFYLGICVVVPLATFVMSMFMTFSPKSSKILSIPYSALEGLSIGCICGLALIYFAETGFLIVGLAFVITLGMFLGGVILYCTGTFKVTNGLRKVMYAILLGSVIASALSSLVALIGYLFGFFDAAFFASIYEAGSPIYLIMTFVSLLMIFVAGIYIVISLDNATKIVEAGLDKEYEWYAAFGIILNLIWLFYQVLRFLIMLFGGSRCD